MNYNVQGLNITPMLAGMQAYSARQEKQQAQERQQQLEQLAQSAMSGNQEALNQLAAIDPAKASQLLQLQKAQQPVEKKPVGKDELLNLASTVKMVATTSPENLTPLLARYAEQYPELSTTINEFDAIFKQSPEAGMQVLDDFIGAGSEPAKEDSFAPEVSPIQTDPDTGQQYVVVTDRNTGQANRVDVQGGKARTGEQKVDMEINKELRKQGIEMSKQAFEDLKPVRSQISNYDEAIKALNQGANSGAIERFLPSFQESTIRLENAARRLGLDVISSTTFGALSEGELRLAMDTAVPMNLPPNELKRWLQDAKKAKQKLAQELFKMGTTLGKGKITPAEYMEKVGYQEMQRTPQEQSTQPANQGGAINWSDL